MQATIFATSSDPNFEIPDNIMYFNPTTNRFEQQGRTNDVNQFSNLNNLSALTANRQEITVLNFEAGDKLNLALMDNTTSTDSVKSEYRTLSVNSEVVVLRTVKQCPYSICVLTLTSEHSSVKIRGNTNQIYGKSYSELVSGGYINQRINF